MLSVPITAKAIAISKDMIVPMANNLLTCIPPAVYHHNVPLHVIYSPPRREHQYPHIVRCSHPWRGCFPGSGDSVFHHSAAEPCFWSQYTTAGPMAFTWTLLFCPFVSKGFGQTAP